MIIEKSKKYIQSKIKELPVLGIILLGVKLDKLIQEMENTICIYYEEIPLFPNLYGKFLFGKIEGKNIVFLIENFFEKNAINYFPMILCKNIGLEKFILINESIGVNPNYKIGDIMFIKDHINFFPEEKNIKNFLGNRLIDITDPYDKNMLDLAEEIAMNQNIIIQKGIYVAFPYSNYKTYSECAMIRSVGGDCVGMEDIITYVMIANRYMNIRVFSVSIINMMGIYDDHIEKENTKVYLFKEFENSISLLTIIIKEFIKCG